MCQIINFVKKNTHWKQNLTIRGEVGPLMYIYHIFTQKIPKSENYFVPDNLDHKWLTTKRMTKNWHQVDMKIPFLSVKIEYSKEKLLTGVARASLEKIGASQQ